MKPVFKTGLLAVAVTLLGCSPQRDNAELEKRVSELEAQVKELKAAKGFDDITKILDQVAYLTPGAQGYSTVRFDLGVLTVQMVDVQPYANGSKITLKFGNTLSSTINGLKATIDWGSVDDKGMPTAQSARSKTITFSETLRSGAWTGVEVILEGTPPADLGYVRVKDITHTGIQLFR